LNTIANARPSAKVEAGTSSAKAKFQTMIVGEDVDEVLEADPYLPALRERRSVGVDEVADVVVGDVHRAGGDVGDAVAGLVIVLAGDPLEGGTQTLAPNRAVRGGHGELGDLSPPGRRLADVQHGVALGRGDLPGTADLECACLECGQTLCRADEGRTRLVGEQEDDVPGRVGADCQLIDGGPGRLGDRRTLDGRDRLFLAAAVTIAEVGERRCHRVDDRHDLEADQKQGADDQVLGRDHPGRQVDGEQQHCRDNDDREADPVLRIDQRHRGEDRNGCDDAEEDQLDDRAQC
jgi:hypothetical protein